MLPYEQKISKTYHMRRQEVLASGAVTEEQMRKLEEKYSRNNLLMALGSKPRNLRDLVGECEMGVLYGQ